MQLLRYWMYKFQEKPYTFVFLTYASIAQVNISLRWIGYCYVTLTSYKKKYYVDSFLFKKDTTNNNFTYILIQSFLTYILINYVMVDKIY